MFLCFIQIQQKQNYPENFDFTRTTEYKYFLDQTTKHTTVAFEYPKAYKDGINEPYYPIPNDDNARLYEKYKKLADSEKNTIFIGRLAEYKYYNMDQIVESALNAFKTKIKGEQQ